MKIKLFLVTVFFTQIVMASTCDMVAKSVRSHEYPALVAMYFGNNGKTPVDLKWISYEGKEVMYRTLKPGHGYTQYTYPSHPWVVRNNNECVGVFYPDGQTRIVLIGTETTNTINLETSSSKEIIEDSEGRLLPPR